MSSFRAMALGGEHEMLLRANGGAERMEDGVKTDCNLGGSIQPYQERMSKRSSGVAVR